MLTKKAASLKEYVEKAVSKKETAEREIKNLIIMSERTRLFSCVFK